MIGRRRLNAARVPGPFRPSTIQDVSGSAVSKSLPPIWDFFQKPKTLRLAWRGCPGLRLRRTQIHRGVKPALASAASCCISSKGSAGDAAAASTTFRF
jgi:hypothetical protein